MSKKSNSSQASFSQARTARLLKRSTLSLLLLSLPVLPPSFPTGKASSVPVAWAEAAPASQAAIPAIPEVTPYLIATAKSAGAAVYADAAHTRLLTRLSQGEEYPILSQTSSTIQLQLLGGQSGYVDKALMTVRPLARMVLGWNAFGDRDAYLTQNRASDQLNVVSPRWFFLDKNDGPLVVSDDTAYVTASHANGQQVWPLFGNRFDSELTARFLVSSSARKAAVSAIVSSLTRTKADGINVDFENIAPANKEDFLVFLRELRDALHPLGKKLSVDVTRTNSDPYWSGSYDRKGIGQIVDIVILMGYDEHWDGSPKAGSVSSLPWIREGVRLLLQDVPAHKVVLGMPFYTYDWAISASGAVTSEYTPLTKAAELVSRLRLTKVWDAAAEQNQVSYTSGGVAHKIWLEDGESMKRRTALLDTYALRGAAVWYMGEETPNVWTAFRAIAPAKPLSSAPSFTDLTGHYASASVSALARSRVITGTAPGLFEPDRSVTRAEFAVLLSRLFIGGTPATSKAASGFRDVGASSWYGASARLLADLGVVNGYPDGRYRPDATIRREEMAVMISRLMTLTTAQAAPGTTRQNQLLASFQDQTSLTWSREGVALALEQGIIQGDSPSFFGGERTATRAEAAVMLARLQEWLSARMDRGL
ncbi:S-layer homology domain-containing protein [Gorillibacterium sp. CAU 1737]|uniref:S-layer homology domain-containing protein n=1 Tax=Gorillibacterium sp. CAU 1737 TaxID=3140362 RepID=UPI0032605E41